MRETLISYGPLLLCPLIMLLCMGGMMRGRRTSSEDAPESLTQEQIQQRIAELRREELALLERAQDGNVDGAPQSSRPGAFDAASRPAREG